MKHDRSYLSAGSEDDVSRSMMIPKDVPSIFVYFTCDSLANVVRAIRVWEGRVEDVKHAFADLLHVDNFVEDTVNHE